MPKRACIGAAALVAASLVACGRGSRVATQPTQVATVAPPQARVEGELDRPPVPVVAGRQVWGLAGREGVELAEQPVPSVFGDLGPAAALSADGRLLAYSTERPVRPIDSARTLSEQGIRAGDPLGTLVLRLHDLQSGTDRVLAEGAYSAAWGPGGRLAYVQGEEPVHRAGRPLRGQVMVRSSPDASPEPWTSPLQESLVVARWAGERLAVYRGIEHLEELMVLDGPGRQRSLGRRDLVAVAPDGQRALLVDPEGSPGTLVVVRLADGVEEARVDASGWPPSVTSVLRGGDWDGRLVVVPVGPEPALAMLEVQGGKATLRTLLGLPKAAAPAGLFRVSLAPGGRVAAFANDYGARQTVVLDCDVDARRCSRWRADGFAYPLEVTR